MTATFWVVLGLATLPAAGNVAGGALFIGLDQAIGYVQGRLGGSDQQAGALAIFSGVAIDLFSDAVMIGAGRCSSLPSACC